MVATHSRCGKNIKHELVFHETQDFAGVLFVERKGKKHLYDMLLGQLTPTTNVLVQSSSGLKLYANSANVKIVRFSGCIISLSATMQDNHWGTLIICYGPMNEFVRFGFRCPDNRMGTLPEIVPSTAERNKIKDNNNNNKGGFLLYGNKSQWGSESYFFPQQKNLCLKSSGWLESWKLKLSILMRCKC